MWTTCATKDTYDMLRKEEESKRKVTLHMSETMSFKRPVDVALGFCGGEALFDSHGRERLKTVHGG